MRKEITLCNSSSYNRFPNLTVTNQSFTPKCLTFFTRKMFYVTIFLILIAQFDKTLRVESQKDPCSKFFVQNLYASLQRERIFESISRLPSWLCEKGKGA